MADLEIWAFSFSHLLIVNKNHFSFSSLTFFSVDQSATEQSKSQP